MKNSSKIVDRIRKALALAENQAGTPEGDTAAKIARQLMQKHAVEVVDLGQDPEDDPMIEHGFEIEKRNQWRRNLAHSLAEHCEVFSLSWGGTNKMTLYGRESGVEVAEYLYSIVVRQVEQHLDDHVAKLKNSGVWGNLSAGRQRSERNSFCRSAVCRIGDRLKALRRGEERQSPTTTALMKRQYDDAKQWARSQGARWRSGSSSYCDWSNAGAAAGSNVSLSPGVRGGQRRPAGLLSG